MRGIASSHCCKGRGCII